MHNSYRALWQTCYQLMHLWYDFISITSQPKGRIASYKQTQKNTIYKQQKEKSNNHTKGGGNARATKRAS